VEVLANIPDLPDLGFTNPALAMPDECKCDDFVESYRRYYRLKEKTIDMRWPNEKPFFMLEQVKELYATYMDN
jgi:hypothetical protein